MKILHLMTSCSSSSASYRLHKSLLNNGIDSSSLVLIKNVKDDNVYVSKSKTMLFNRLYRKVDSFLVKFYKNRLTLPFSSSILGNNVIINEIAKINPDIVHMHWINGGFISIDNLKNIKIPIVFSMHDNWVFTGGCHVKWDCQKYKEECGKCPVLNSNSDNDLSKILWSKKLDIISNITNITFVGLSKWLTKIAKDSSLLQNKQVVNLPNPIDINIFKKINKIEARKKFNLPLEKNLILYGAVNATTDINKGFKQLLESINKLGSNIELVLFGNTEENIIIDDVKIYSMGFINDINKMALLYSSADVMIIPSLQENLSNAIMESLSCGTPVVAFDIGGNSDMIEHQVNGYLAEKLDTDDLARGIDFVLQNDNYDILSKNAREKVIQTFESNLVAKRYKQLYEEILENA